MKSFPGKGKVESLPATQSRFRAREAMEQQGYDPIQRLIQIDKKLECEEGIDAIKIQMDIAKKLLEYYTEKPPTHQHLALTQSQHVIIRPAEFLDPLYLGTEGASQPAVLDILGEAPEPSEQEKTTGDEELSQEALAELWTSADGHCVEVSNVEPNE